MPEQFPESWEYWTPDPEIAELLGADVLVNDLTCEFEGANFTVRGGSLTRPNAICIKCGDPFICRNGSTTICGKPKCVAARRVKTLAKHDARQDARRLIPYRCATCRTVHAHVWKGKKYCSMACNPYQNWPYRKPPPLPKELTVSLDEARDLIAKGVLFGDVFPLLPSPSDGELLKDWYTTNSALPNIAAREPITPIVTVPDPEKPLSEISGRAFKKSSGDPYISHEPCGKCGCQQFVPGACPTCFNCGESSKGCG